jgi:hypothetical protein
MLLAFLKTGANDVGGLFAKVWAYIKSFFDGSDLQEEFEKIDAETAAKNAGVQSQRDGTLFARQGDRQQQLDAIESDRQLALASIDDQQASADEARRRAAADSLAAGDAELARLRGELEAALAEAAAKAVPAEAEGAGGAAAGPGRLTPEGLGASLDRAARKTDVKGTFSAAALRGFGAGDSAADRTADAAEKTAEGIQRLNDRARQGRLVFTS